jgi:glyoxylase-like metal-dependent hydrolase (beta-lactamase superfamily II)
MRRGPETEIEVIDDRTRHGVSPPTARVGGLEIRAFNDGLLKTSLDYILNLDRETSESLVGGTKDGSLYIPVNNFVFEVDGKILMIDAGCGNTMQPTLGKLPENLRAGGVAPEAITHIILTHIHPDHANGLIDDDGAPQYPNAEILVHEKEFDFWMGDDNPGEPDRIKHNRARNKLNLKPYLERTRRMRDGEERLGCSPILAAGHTPGHTCWRIGSGRDAWFSWGDLVHLSAVQVAHPEAALTYDLDPDAAAVSRRRILDMAAADRVFVAGAHVNAPGFGYVVRKGRSFAIEPS